MSGNRSMLSIAAVLVVTLALASFAQADNPAGGALGHKVWLETLDLINVFQDYGAPGVCRSTDGNPMKLKGVLYSHGLGTHANSRILIDLHGEAERFSATVGIDDDTGTRGLIAFRVFVDDKQVVDTGIMHPGDEPKQISVDLTGAKKLLLVAVAAGPTIDWDHADWAGAFVQMVPAARHKAESIPFPVDPPIPMASGVSDKPAIHGPRIVGTTPGRPFLFLIPATGKGPLVFSAENLPAGLRLDTQTGIISGSLAAAGRSVVEIAVKSRLGRAKRNLVIVGGDHELALTPPMGWNSWNVWAGDVNDARIRAAADWMVKTGLAAHGFQYINIDDTWEAGRPDREKPGRDANGEIRTNSRFPDMKALADYVHSKGLKLGIYSSPGPKTCGFFPGSYQHEDQDAATYAKWGIDYLKYDWCSYGPDVADKETGTTQLERWKKPYAVMRASLDKVNRDIVYSFCQYGMGEVWKWAPELGGNCWRTDDDINDSWNSLSHITFTMNGREQYAGPGHWNDPDMLVVGWLGWGPHIRPTHLTPNEQILHITAWCLVSSPLLIGCDMSRMDQFTVDILSNDEVLDINQDPLGKPAKRIATAGDAEVWARPLWDGTTAFGIMNRGEAATVTVNWSDLGLSGSQPVRDLWQKKDLGTSYKSFTATVPKHGALLYKVGKPNRTEW